MQMDINSVSLLLKKIRWWANQQVIYFQDTRFESERGDGVEVWQL